jgi:hypothetical protein
VIERLPTDVIFLTSVITKEYILDENILFYDKLIEIRDNAILFSNYYFPTFSAKTVKFQYIEKILLEKPTLKKGKYRFWGTGDFTHWFPLDNQRSKRDVIFILFRKNKKIRIGFTVEDSKKVRELLKGKVTLYFKNY